MKIKGKFIVLNSFSVPPTSHVIEGARATLFVSSAYIQTEKPHSPPDY
jgi:hypothetical protein